jgi:hypothetical protein
MPPNTTTTPVQASVQMVVVHGGPRAGVLGVGSETPPYTNSQYIQKRVVGCGGGT